MNPLRRLPIFALVALASLSFAQDKKTLRLNVKPGTVMTSTSVTDGKYAMTIPQDQEFKNKVTMVQQTKFDAGSDGWLKFLVETTDFKLEGDQMNMMGTVDPEQIIAQAKKVKISGEVSGTGTTRNVDLVGSEDLDMMSKQMMAGIADRITQIGLMSMFYPDQAVGVGDTWKKEIDLGKSLSSIEFFTNVNGKAPVEFTIESFEKVEDKDTVKVKVFVDGRVTFDLNIGTSASGNMTTTSAGHVWIDLSTGLPVKSETKLANNIDFGMGTMQQEIAITTSVVVKS